MFNLILDRNWSDTVIVRPRKQRKLPCVLSRDQILSIVEHVSSLKHRTIFLTAYSGGLRISEVLSLAVSDIDSRNMLIRVRGGKGSKDRFTLLGKENLRMLRSYWKIARTKGLLFPGQSPGQPLCSSNIQKVFRAARDSAGAPKAATVHSLRHSFGTHILESGTDLRTIQTLMGHAAISTTCIYLHLSTEHLSKVRSPMDRGEQ